MQFTRPASDRDFEGLALFLIGALIAIYGVPALWRWGTARPAIPEHEVWRPGHGPNTKDKHREK
jgi:hypothetical protein